MYKVDRYYYLSYKDEIEPEYKVVKDISYIAYKLFFWDNLDSTIQGLKGYLEKELKLVFYYKGEVYLDSVDEHTVLRLINNSYVKYGFKGYKSHTSTTVHYIKSHKSYRYRHPNTLRHVKYFTKLLDYQYTKKNRDQGKLNAYIMADIWDEKVSVNSTGWKSHKQRHQWG